MSGDDKFRLWSAVIAMLVAYELGRERERKRDRSA